jgi:uncharacterized protein YbjT (DUF2867 family)
MPGSSRAPGAYRFGPIYEVFSSHSGNAGADRAEHLHGAGGRGAPATPARPPGGAAPGPAGRGRAVVLVVTGATGTVGRHVLAGLRDLGVPVRALSRHDQAADGWARFSFGDPAGWPAAFAGASGLFLVRPPQLARLRDLRPALEHARAAGVRRVVFLSVLGAERLPPLPHRRIERWLDASGMAATHLRAGNFLQNLVTVHGAQIRDHDELVVPAGSARLSYVDARDVAAVAVRCLVEDGHAGRAYSPTGPEALDHARVAAVLGDVLGRPIAHRPGLPRYWRLARRAGSPAGPVLAGAAVYTLARFGVGARVTGDVRAVLGREPVDLRAFVESHRSAWLPAAR